MLFEPFYDDSNVDITIKSAFTALFKFAVFKNGASTGIRLEPYCDTLVHLCLHNEDTIEQSKKFLNCNNLLNDCYN